MTNARYMTTAALALGAAILATIVLQSTPVEAGPGRPMPQRNLTGKQPNPNGPTTYLPGNKGGGKGPTGKQPNPNLPWGNGGGKSGPHKHRHFGIHVGVGGYGGAYRPCRSLRRNYYMTGRVYWLNRYRLCLRRHFN